MRATATIHPERIKLLNDCQSRDSGRYVLYWMQAAQRAEDNPALEFAVQRANSLGCPLVTLFVLTPHYPEANLRHYTFLLEGLVDTFQELKLRGILPRLEIGKSAQEVVRYADDATELILDKGYLRPQREWYRQVLKGCTCRTFQVEGEAVVPVELASTKAEYAARTIRPRIHRYLHDFLVGLTPTRVEHDSSLLDMAPAELTENSIPGLTAKLSTDDRVKPASVFFRGGPKQAKKLFDSFLSSKLGVYEEMRNQPQTDETSTMSPYLHYGMVSPVYLATTLLDRAPEEDANTESFLEELIVRRGLAQNFTHFTPNYDSYDCLPDWALKTLAEHRDDSRPDGLTPEQMERAQSHDPYWNAAQLEMVETGYMHNYMRMYWGKKILEWSAGPREAYETTLRMNNRYFLDGRDPVSFASVAWIYGLHDRAWQERAIYGKVRIMTSGGLERKNDPRAYVAKVEERTGREVAGKDWLF